MTPADRVRARKSLEGLRADFAAEAERKPDLYGVLFCASSFKHPKIGEIPPVPEAGRPMWQRAWVDFANNRIVLTFYYFGDKREEDRFGRLALHASRVWEGLAPPPRDHPTTGIDWDYSDLLPRFHALVDRLDVPLWLLVVHSLAWRNLPGTPLVCRRKIWDRTWPVAGHFTLPFEQEQRRERLGSCSRELREHVESQPPADHFFSMLPDDLYRCSVYAINLLLEGSDHPTVPVHERVTPRTDEGDDQTAGQASSSTALGGARNLPKLPKGEPERRIKLFIDHHVEAHGYRGAKLTVGHIVKEAGVKSKASVSDSKSYKDYINKYQEENPPSPRTRNTASSKFDWLQDRSDPESAAESRETLEVLIGEMTHGEERLRLLDDLNHLRLDSDAMIEFSARAKMVCERLSREIDESVPPEERAIPRRLLRKGKLETVRLTIDQAKDAKKQRASDDRSNREK